MGQLWRAWAAKGRLESAQPLDVADSGEGLSFVSLHGLAV